MKRFAPILIFSLLNIAAWSSEQDSTQKPTQSNSSGLFLNVEKFSSSKPVNFLSYTSRLATINPFETTTWKYSVHLFDKITPIVGHSFATKIENKSFYFLTQDEAVEIDADMNVVRRFSIHDYGNELSDSTFGGNCQIHDKRLWFSAKTKIGPNKIEYLVYEWDTTKPPSQAKFCGASDNDFWLIDSTKNRIITTGEKVAISDIALKFTYKTIYKSYTCVDLDNEKGLLLSNGPLSENKDIMIYNPETDEEKILAKGTVAIWGNADYIYFSRGTSQLWRLDITTNKEEPVYMATEKEVIGDPYPVLPVMDKNKEFLAFFCSIPQENSNFPRLEVVLFDLVKGEYVKPESLHSAGMGWIKIPG